ncbi:hypothetical protein [Streptomyces sp. CB03238]|uniref:hypothetical protein n=1 Tax=Streptomyces sp. CB03238 TaxID=1907777 RepID=UPI000A0F59CA|nr:hypothetical protein [Streptomyces sp. CB03238]ORT54575.1 hypothetical protein BKD26_35120 [Streptomyces sp. CB03238]
MKVCASPRDRDPASVQVLWESDEKLGELIVWGNGMAGIQAADVYSGVIVRNNRQVLTREDVASAFDRLISSAKK